MTVSIDSTTKKYHGRKAETYEAVRTKQQRWDIENAEVKWMLKKLRPKSVLDVPCGTGRFLSTYGMIGVKHVIGVDVSNEMLDQAAEKAKHVVKKTGILIELKQRDVRKLKPVDVDVSVCVRFLDLIDELAMREVIKILMIRSKRAIICTIRLGEQYVAKSNTATHDEKKFQWFLKRNGWKIAKCVPVFNQGWFILLLKPR